MGFEVDVAAYDDLTFKVIGCAMTVHRKLKMGFPEVVYQRALAIELFKQGVSAEREIELPVFYDDEKVGSRRVDFFVEGRVVLELKAVECLTKAHEAQLLSYLEAFKIQVGLLLNFGTQSLEFQRVIKNIKPNV